MRAVVYVKPESFSVTEVPDPYPGPGETRSKVLQAGACGTDLHLHHGEFAPENEAASTQTGLAQPEFGPSVRYGAKTVMDEVRQATGGSR